MPRHLRTNYTEASEEEAARPAEERTESPPETARRSFESGFAPLSIIPGPGFSNKEATKLRQHLSTGEWVSAGRLSQMKMKGEILGIAMDLSSRTRLYRRVGLHSDPILLHETAAGVPFDFLEEDAVAGIRWPNFVSPFFENLRRHPRILSSAIEIMGGDLDLEEYLIAIGGTLKCFTRARSFEKKEKTACRDTDLHRVLWGAFVLAGGVGKEEPGVLWLKEEARRDERRDFTVPGAVTLVWKIAPSSGETLRGIPLTRSRRLCPLDPDVLSQL
ncbi:MAG: hypothetical protein D6679_04555 [Candidatus Hydrogenedentota bacterium]|nr:MAG: hypothetical protein D6679_04555 [Candidatus Hydrogenedentota bacterium]